MEKVDYVKGLKRNRNNFYFTYLSKVRENLRKEEWMEKIDYVKGLKRSGDNFYVTTSSST